jgi:hypothetical protein
VAQEFEDSIEHAKALGEPSHFAQIVISLEDQRDPIGTIPVVVRLEKRDNPQKRTRGGGINGWLCRLNESPVG